MVIPHHPIQRGLHLDEERIPPQRPSHHESGGSRRPVGGRAYGMNPLPIPFQTPSCEAWMAADLCRDPQCRMLNPAKFWGAPICWGQYGYDWLHFCKPECKNDGKDPLDCIKTYRSIA
ncbi:hypothetical protein CSIM01_05253 [Colletotrichum simmondsii]|uniref:Uncharacterized protein n=1 Tax=Colletotrichum simmondsii TaxID=703756 RepID=A0A135SB27_9PEZI|nr:hypothetical protein CSIM01_05253 [Colletotrichum simmondsii]